MSLRDGEWGERLMMCRRKGICLSLLEIALRLLREVIMLMIGGLGGLMGGRESSLVTTPRRIDTFLFRSCMKPFTVQLIRRMDLCEHRV